MWTPSILDQDSRVNIQTRSALVSKHMEQLTFANRSEDGKVGQLWWKLNQQCSLEEKMVCQNITKCNWDLHQDPIFASIYWNPVHHTYTLYHSVLPCWIGAAANQYRKENYTGQTGHFVVEVDRLGSGPLRHGKYVNGLDQKATVVANFATSILIYCWVIAITTKQTKAC